MAIVMLLRCLIVMTLLCSSGCGAPSKNTSERAGLSYEDDAILLKAISATVGGVQYEDESGALLDPDQEKPLLQVVVKITNKTDSRRIATGELTQPSLTGVSPTVPATDNFGNEYQHIPGELFGIRPAGFADQGTINPGESASCILLYEPPVENAEWIQLQLPRSAYRESGSITLRIPGDFIARQEPR